jgi:hypothetical protein
MPKTASKSKSTQLGATMANKEKAPIVLNSYLKDEIVRLAEMHGISASALEEFSHFVIENYKKKEPKAPKVSKAKPLSLPQLKAAVFEHFDVTTVKELKASSNFQMATSGMEKLDLSKKTGWETLYRKFVGILPEEKGEVGYGCINGINIFKYDMPWNAFGLEPQTSNTEDVKSAYRNLSKIYHPDIPDTGDAEIFDRLTTFYKSLTEKF